MDLARLKYFAAVAEMGSFSRAAAALHLTQPSLSRQVKLLEEELGQHLLERHGRGVVTTEAGTALLGHARAILDLAKHAKADMEERRANPRGRLTIGLPPRVAHVIATDFVEQFRAQYPDASVAVTEGPSLRLRELVIAGRVDVALLFDPTPSPQVLHELLLREPLVLVSKRPLPDRVSLADLVKHRLVMGSAPNALRRLLDEHATSRGLSLMIVAEVDAVQTVLDLVARGVADSVVPRSATRSPNEYGTLRAAEIYAPIIRNKLVLAQPTARPASRLSRFGGELLRQLVARSFGGKHR